MPTEKTDTKSVSWFLTVNNPTEEEEDVIGVIEKHGILPEVKYLKYAVENGEENDVRHMHIYLHLTSQQRFSCIKKMFKRARIEEPIGTPQNQIDYIGNPEYVYSAKHSNPDKRGRRKGGTCEYVKEYGTTDGIRLQQRQGNNNTVDARLHRLKTLIDSGASIMDLYETDFPTMIKYGSRVTEYMTHIGIIEEKKARDVAREKEREEDRIYKEAALRMTKALNDNEELPF